METATLFCVNCKHFRGVPEKKLSTGQCWHPSNLKWVITHDMVTGEEISPMPKAAFFVDFASILREHGVCGVGAKNYEQKDLSTAISEALEVRPC